MVSCSPQWAIILGLRSNLSQYHYGSTPQKSYKPHMRTMVLEYLPTFTRTKYNKITQSCRFLYTSTMVRIWEP